MASPHFIDRSFAQLARRAIARCSYGTPRESDLAQTIINRAKVADAAAARGPHSEQGRAYDRRIGIGRRARMVAALVAVASELSQVGDHVADQVRAQVRAQVAGSWLQA